MVAMIYMCAGSNTQSFAKVPPVSAAGDSDATAPVAGPSRRVRMFCPAAVIWVERSGIFTYVVPPSTDVWKTTSIVGVVPVTVVFTM